MTPLTSVQTAVLYINFNYKPQYVLWLFKTSTSNNDDIKTRFKHICGGSPDVLQTNQSTVNSQTGWLAEQVTHGQDDLRTGKFWRLQIFNITPNSCYQIQLSSSCWANVRANPPVHELPGNKLAQWQRPLVKCRLWFMQCVKSPQNVDQPVECTPIFR